MRLATTLAISLALASSSITARAQQVKLKPEAVRGKTIVMAGGAHHEYRSDGSYIFRNGNQFGYGGWQISADGGVCVFFNASNISRCIHYFEGDGVLFVGDAHGKLRRVRAVK